MSETLVPLAIDIANKAYETYKKDTFEMTVARINNDLKKHGHSMICILNVEEIGYRHFNLMQKIEALYRDANYRASIVYDNAGATLYIAAKGEGDE